MYWTRAARRHALGILLVLTWSEPLMAQTPPAADQHEHAQMNRGTSPWMFMTDATVYAMFNHQGGPRGADEFKVPNWWMGMASRPAAGGQLTFTAMLSLDPLTVGKSGYAEIFQVGEALEGRPLVDRQHPHDLFMQLAAVWRRPLSNGFALTLAGGPAGEPALGPIAFMHRPSAENIVLAPLGHHTFDSTHISFAVVTAAIERGPWTVEWSVFNGREPDDDRWDINLARMDSVAGRLWFRPSRAWEFQISTGHLVEPEELEPGDLQRTTASASWFSRAKDDDFSAVTAGYGVNAAHDTRRQAGFVEFTRHLARNAVSLRGELAQSELRAGTVGAVTLGGARDLAFWKGLEAAVGGDVTLYRVPDASKSAYGSRPVSLQLFVRFRTRPGHMGRMWNMRMSRPM
jgi:hypothetical protein